MIVFITGGHGRLARLLHKHFVSRRIFVVNVDHSILDVCNQSLCVDVIRRIASDPPIVVIHCAAVLSVESEKNHSKAYAVNAVGTRNMALASDLRAARFVYISSDHVFDGDLSKLSNQQLASIGYSESDPINPVNYYGFTKALGEEAARQANDHLILRAPFRHGWEYPEAYVDHWSSTRWAEEVVPDIAEAALSDLQGVLHIGGERRSTFELAKEKKPDVVAASRTSWTGFRLPMDVSLDSSRWRAWKAQERGK